MTGRVAGARGRPAWIIRRIDAKLRSHTLPIALAFLLTLSATPATGSEVKELIVEYRATLTEQGAARLLDGAKAEAVARGVDVSIAVVDRDGQLLAFWRLGRAGQVTINNAIAKARTAAQLGAPSKILEDAVDGGKTSYLAIDGMVPLQGGVPVIVGGEVIGGIGCSGASADVDEAIAMAAVQVLTE